MRQQEEYIIDQHQGLMGRMLMSQAISQFVPSKGSQFSETLQYSLHNNTLAYMGEVGRRTFGDDTLVPQDMWKEELHPNYRDGIKWHESMTEIDSKILAERYDRDLAYQDYMGNTDAWSWNNIGAALTSAVWDPLSYIPFVGPFAKVGQALHKGAKATTGFLSSMKVGDIGSTISLQAVSHAPSAVTRIAQVSRLSKILNPIAATAGSIFKPMKPIGTYAAEGVLAESSYQIIKNMAEAREEDDIDHIGGIFDVMIAGIFGGILGTLPMANAFRRNFKKEHLHMAMAKSLDDLKQNGEVGMSPNGEKRKTSTESRDDFNAEMDNLHTSQDHTNDPDLHPVQDWANSVNQDVKEVVLTALKAWKRCSS